jgi:hypothetical protein
MEERKKLDVGQNNHPHTKLQNYGKRGKKKSDFANLAF